VAAMQSSRHAIATRRCRVSCRSVVPLLLQPSSPGPRSLTARSLSVHSLAPSSSYARTPPWPAPGRASCSCALLLLLPPAKLWPCVVHGLQQPSLSPPEPPVPAEPTSVAAFFFQCRRSWWLGAAGQAGLSLGRARAWASRALAARRRRPSPAGRVGRRPATMLGSASVCELEKTMGHARE